jgi:RimJ/RimL family protein N-acetyltransferase
MTIIRPISTQDSDLFLELLLNLDNETRLMMMEPGERKTRAEEMPSVIERIKNNGEVFVVEDSRILVGFLSIQRESYQRNRHSAYIVIGILQSWVGKGLGKELFCTAETWARSQGLHRLELTVMTHNERGIALYQKMGFEIEGTRHHSLKVDGVYVDEYMMAKLLE